MTLVCKKRPHSPLKVCLLEVGVDERLHGFPTFLSFCARAAISRASGWRMMHIPLHDMTTWKTLLQRHVYQVPQREQTSVLYTVSIRSWSMMCHLFMFIYQMIPHDSWQWHLRACEYACIHTYIPIYDIFVSVHAMIFPFEVGGWHPRIERTESFARPRGAWVVNVVDYYRFSNIPTRFCPRGVFSQAWGLKTMFLSGDQECYFFNDVKWMSLVLQLKICYTIWYSKLMRHLVPLPLMVFPFNRCSLAWSSWTVTNRADQKCCGREHDKCPDASKGNIFLLDFEQPFNIYYIRLCIWVFVWNNRLI